MYYSCCVCCNSSLALQQFDSTYYVIADNSYILSCTIIGNLQSNDTITFEWSKDNSSIDNSDIAQTRKVNSRTSQLIIEKLNPDLHSGEYSCKAINNNSSSNSASDNTNIIIESESAC